MPDLTITLTIPYEGAEADEDQKRRIGQRLATSGADIVEEELGADVNRDGIVIEGP